MPNLYSGNAILYIKSPHNFQLITV